MKKLSHSWRVQIVCKPQTVSEFARLLLSSASDLFWRKQRVHRTRAESFQIEGHELEPNFSEDAAELCCHLYGHGARHFIASDFYARNVSMMAYPKLPEPQSPQCIFTLLHHSQRFGRDLAAIFNSRRQARRRRLVPDAQSSFSRQSADLFFAESSIQ